MEHRLVGNRGEVQNERELLARWTIYEVILQEDEIYPLKARYRICM